MAAHQAPRPWDSPGKNTGVGCQFLLQCMKVKSESEVTQSCPTLGDPMDCSLPDSSVHGILQARVLVWGAIAFSGERLTEGETGLVLMGGAMLCKSLIQFSVDGQGCVPSLLYVLRPNCGRGNEDNGLLQRSHAHTATRSAPNLLSTHTSTGDSWTRTGKSGSVSCGVTAPFSWVLVHKVVCATKSLFPQSCVSAGSSRVGLMATSSKRAYAVPTSTMWRREWQTTSVFLP